MTPDVPILMANRSRDGAGLAKVIADIEPGDWVWTQHHTSMAWGAYRIASIKWSTEPVYHAAGLPTAVGDHCFWRAGEWFRMSDLGTAAGNAMVARIVVNNAETYVSAGILSRND